MKHRRTVKEKKMQGIVQMRKKSLKKILVRKRTEERERETAKPSEL